MSHPLYPLRFEPILRRYLWGGRRLATVLHKPLPPGDDYAESWELCDRKDDQSAVTAGPLRDATLGELVQTCGRDLLGRHAPLDRFPLLIKLLDAQKVLSVQVHPHDAQAALLSPPDLGKTEAWLVLATEPGSVIYAGLKRGFDRHALEREINRGTCELCLHRFEPQVGDCLFIPAGTVHALGAGLVIAEVQQSSDVTYRLYDWNRVGADGRPRPLHVEAALDVIDFDRGPVNPIRPEPTERPQIEQLVACDKFVLERWQLHEPLTTPADNECRVLLVVAGQVDVAGDPSGEPLLMGQTMLLPASLGAVQIRPRGTATILCGRLP
ncbi:MAG: class I mannose-6-phosphate isomerase [Planctomycetes bacterium]|nr:class I mannose-6-phosphate isomerase [Planctomycetota bacterium]